MPLNMLIDLISLILVLLACLSPLLTLAHLWQLKEWRIDRLREHLQREGWLLPIFGTLRPIIVIAYLFYCAYLLFVVLPTVDEAGLIIALELLTTTGVALLLLASLSAVQFLLRRQPMPVWTSKAIMIVSTAFLLDAVGVFFLIRDLTPMQSSLPFLLPLVVLLQPFSIGCAWLLLQPVDQYLKHQIIQKARRLRMSRNDSIVIGITGSVGKTTTKELLQHILKEKGSVATPSYVNAEIGVARWLISTLQEKNPPILIVEMGAYRTGEIAVLCSIAQPQMGIITFIGTQHIALFGSQEALCQAKGELVRALPANGHAFLNADSALCAGLQPSIPCPVTTVGTGGHADLEAFDIEETSSGIRFRLSETRFEVPLHGTHNVTNVLLAIAAAEQAGLKRSEIASRLQSFVPLAGTFAVRTERGVTILDDTHNSSETSFRAAIEWARNQPISKKTLLTPGLIELGSDAESIHTQLGALASSVFDRVIFTGDNGRAAFQKGFGKTIEQLGSSSITVEKDSLLACVGRVKPQTITSLLS